MRAGRRRLTSMSALLTAGLMGVVGCSSARGVVTAPSATPVLPTATPTPTPSPTPAPWKLEALGTFASPVWAGPAPGDGQHVYLVEKTGTVLRLDNAGRVQKLVLDLRSQVSQGNEQGLLSMVFDPSYARSHRFYVDYTDLSGATRVVAYTVVAGVAVRPQLLLAVPQPYPNHNGGLVLFDRTGMLLVGMGDGGNAGDPHNFAQDLRSLHGKILRLDPRTGAPAKGNPFPQAPYVWAFGLRNPWRFSFDSDGWFYLGDIGQDHEEELDVVAPSLQRGANYEWSVFEGTYRYKSDITLTPGGPYVSPAITYGHDKGGCSITAGEVYAGTALPRLRNRFLYGDYCSGRMYAVTRTASGEVGQVDLGVRAEGGLQGFGHDVHGELLVLTLDTVYRLIPRPLVSPSPRA